MAAIAARPSESNTERAQASCTLGRALPGQGVLAGGVARCGAVRWPPTEPLRRVFVSGGGTGFTVASVHDSDGLFFAGKFYLENYAVS